MPLTLVDPAPGRTPFYRVRGHECGVCVNRSKLHLLDLGGDIAGNGISKLFLTIARHSLKPSATASERELDRQRPTRSPGGAF
jgi:hypothetical protein